MPSFERAVREAVASPNTPDQLGGIGSNRYLYWAYADTPDGTPMWFKYSRLNRVPTDDPDDLYTILELAIHFGRIPDSYFPTIGSATANDYIKETVEHEKDHGTAARAQSVQRIRYGLMVFTTSQSRLVMMPLMEHAGTVPKIGAAAIHVFPEDPSPGDLNSIKMLGYADVDDVRLRARAYNESGSGPAVPIRECGVLLA